MYRMKTQGKPDRSESKGNLRETQIYTGVESKGNQGDSDI